MLEFEERVDGGEVERVALEDRIGVVDVDDEEHAYALKD